jgi:O-acetyl-ADP-ribose deacetylase (regulator of RNase III)
MKRVLGTLTVECVTGDITRQEGFDAVVNAANAQLRPGGGVAGAIHSAAGPGLYEECRALAPIRPGEAVITGGHGLPNRHVIHCLGPVYGQDVPSDVLLADCYRNALRLADEHGLLSVAFPAISTGIFGYPVVEAARVALRAVAETAAGLSTVRRVRFVLHGEESLRAHEQALADVSEGVD